MTVYTSSSLRHPHSINSRIQARFLHNFMAAWIPIGLCMNTFWLSLPHSWSRAIIALHKIYFRTCTEVGKENVWKCQEDVTCHGHGNSYVGQLIWPQHSIHTYSEMAPCLKSVSTYKVVNYAHFFCLGHAVQFEHKCKSCYKYSRNVPRAEKNPILLYELNSNYILILIICQPLG